MSILSQQKQSVNTDFPNLRPSLDLRFALAKKLDPRITFTRGTSGTYFGPDGLMRTAGVNEPRFDHDPITGQSLGLFIEESRQNIALQSENINTSPWDTSTLTFATNSIVAPDGNTTADKLIENPSFSSFKTTAQSVGTISGTYAVSGFFKAGERFRGYLQLFGSGGNATVIFNLKTGTITGGAGINTIAPYGNGWYRVSSTATFTSATAAIYIVVQNDSGVSSYTGDGTSGIYVWGAQVEKGAFPTSYIPTVASTVTRSADNADMTGTNFSSWYNSSEGTLYANAKSNGNTTQIPGIAALNNSSSPTTNRVDLRYDQSGSSQSVFNGVGGGGGSMSRISGFSLTNPKFVVSYASQNVNFAANASLISSRTSAFVPSPLVNRLLIGTFDAGTIRQINGTISRLTYYPIQLTNQQLINLCS